jgi:light-regulated signal transduction histidine kinase (bacteriophytochrome)
MKVTDLGVPDEAERFAHQLADGGEGISAAGTWRHRRRDGSLIDVEITCNVIELDGRRVLLALCTDVSARLASERALRQLNAQLEARVAERTAALTATNQELEAFSYSVSHDLRAPLRAIVGFSKILQEDHAGGMAPEALRCLDVIERNARQMGQLIDDLLAFSRLGRQPVTAMSVDMASLARQVADEALRSEAERAVALTVHDLPTARGERALLRQVFANYIDNAVKFTRRRDRARIEVGHYAENGEIVYFVRDNGAGFDPRYSDKLFGVFQRLHRADEFEGTGVGLAIVKRIVNRHGGRVWAEGAEGEGATFYFTLPVESGSHES